MINKAVRNAFLGYYERKLLSYIFPQIGDEGVRFIHFIMKDFLDYNYNTTQKHLKKAPPNAISCPKLRQYITLELGNITCTCRFDSQKGEYPSPVLHAGVAQTVTDCRQDEIQGVFQRLLDATRQKNDLEKQILQLEKEIDSFFTVNNIQEYKLPMGMLKRSANNKKWIIEIE